MCFAEYEELNSTHQELKEQLHQYIHEANKTQGLLMEEHGRTMTERRKRRRLQTQLSQKVSQVEILQNAKEMCIAEYEELKSTHQELKEQLHQCSHGTVIFQKKETISSLDISDIDHFTTDGTNTYVVVKTVYHLSIYKLSDEGRLDEMVRHRLISESGFGGIKYFELDGHHFIAVSEYLYTVVIYEWTPSKFKRYQVIVV
ncbi:uncharacterized protein LOC144445577 isoform X2 [Glandiceps talaboti]